MKKFGRRTLLVVILIPVILLIGIFLAVGPALSCNFPTYGAIKPGLSVRTLISSGEMRCYLLYVPVSYEPTEPIPVVFSLHGFAGTPLGLRKITGWEQVADKINFIVVYPHGSSFPLRWNTSPIAKIEQIDDVKLISDILESLSSIARVDLSRVYVTGFSQGATMTDQIACELSDQVTAVGMVSGFGDDASQVCDPTRPVPIILFYGTEDPLNKIEKYPWWFYRVMNILPNEEYRENFPLDEWIDGWVSRNGCIDTTEVILHSSDVKGLSYGECDENTKIIIYMIDGGGHTWPGGRNSSVFGKTSEINASEMMWKFFENYSLKGEP